MRARTLATVLLGSLLAAALQNESLFRLRLGSTKADLVIVFIACCGMLWGMRGGLLSGVLAGLLQALSQGSTVGSLIASRTLTGYLVGRGAVVVAAEQTLMAVPVALAATALCESLYYLLNPWLNFAGWARLVAGEAVLNAGLAIPLHWLVLRAGGAARPR